MLKKNAKKNAKKNVRKKRQKKNAKKCKKNATKEGFIHQIGEICEQFFYLHISQIEVTIKRLKTLNDSLEATSNWLFMNSRNLRQLIMHPVNGALYQRHGSTMDLIPFYTTCRRCLASGNWRLRCQSLCRRDCSTIS